MGNRAERRRQQRKGTLPYDMSEAFVAKCDFSLPGGLLRDKTPVRLAGTITADNESDLLSNLIIKFLDATGYINSEEAASGVIAEALNRYPAKLRGQVAMALIEGSGLYVGKDPISICADCGARKEESLVPVGPDGNEDSEEGDDEAEYARYVDTTPHTKHCAERARDEGRDVEWKEEEAVVVMHVRKFAPLTRTAPPETEPESEVVDTDVVEAETEEEDAAVDA